jgi:predicted nucleic acid-binding protein
MAWLVDTCVVIDVAEGDPQFGDASARHLQSKLRQGLLISPVTYAELGPVFDGSADLQEEFLAAAGIRFDEPWTREDTLAAHRTWSTYVKQRRWRAMPKRPLADILIGAMACRCAGLITRNPEDFRLLFPGLAISEPKP